MIGLAILIGGAFLPALLIILWIRRLDKARPEPIGLIWRSVFYGFLSTIPAIILEKVIGLGESYMPNVTFGAIWTAFVTAALVEESVKYFFLKKYLYKRTEFDEVMDGIVYAICVSLGFAFAENILYGSSSGMTVLILRAFTSVPLHASATGIMGFYLGLAKTELVAEKAKKTRFKGLLIAIFIHGLYDFFLMIPTKLGILSLVVLIIASRLLSSYIAKAKAIDNVNLNKFYTDAL